jgi:type IV pilus assembly protein PilW
MTRHIRTRGFTVVELMIAMTLGLILLAGILSVLYSSKITYTENERTARLQEYARAGIDMILKDMRSGGFFGCRYAGAVEPATSPLARNFTTNLANPTNVMWNFGRAIEGFDADGASWDPALAPSSFIPSGNPTPEPTSDIVAIRTVRSNAPQFTATAVPLIGATTPISVTKLTTETVVARNTYVASDCEKAVVFAATAVTSGGLGTTSATIAFDATAGGALDPVNAVTTLPGLSAVRTTVTPVDTIVYYVAPSADLAGPALWRRVGRRAPEELIEGVENLQIEFGIDTDADLLADDYVEAPAVTNWTAVVAARIAVLMRSPEETGTEVDTASYRVLGETIVAPGDRRQRLVFSTTANLRNRTPGA